MYSGVYYCERKDGIDGYKRFLRFLLVEESNSGFN